MPVNKTFILLCGLLSHALAFQAVIRERQLRKGCIRLGAAPSSGKRRRRKGPKKSETVPSREDGLDAKPNEVRIELPPMPEELAEEAAAAAGKENSGRLEKMRTTGGEVKEEATEEDTVSSKGTLIELPPMPEELKFPQATDDQTSESLFPVPTERRVAPKPDGRLSLPGFEAVAKRAAERKREAVDRGTKKKSQSRLEKFDRDEYTKVIESDPNADVDPNLVRRDDVDFFSILLGEGADKFFGIESAYLQIGHAALLPVLLIAAFVYEPAFPLTDAPEIYRSFIKQGLLLTYLINAAVAFLAFQEAKRKAQPPAFWLVKSFFLGGVSLNQLRSMDRINRSR